MSSPDNVPTIVLYVQSMDQAIAFVTSDVFVARNMRNNRLVTTSNKLYTNGSLIFNIFNFKDYRESKRYQYFYLFYLIRKKYSTKKKISSRKLFEINDIKSCDIKNFSLKGSQIVSYDFDSFKWNYIIFTDRYSRKNINLS